MVFISEGGYVREAWMCSMWYQYSGMCYQLDIDTSVVFGADLNHFKVMHDTSGRPITKTTLRIIESFFGTCVEAHNNINVRFITVGWDTFGLVGYVAALADADSMPLAALAPPYSRRRRHE